MRAPRRKVAAGLGPASASSGARTIEASHCEGGPNVNLRTMTADELASVEGGGGLGFTVGSLPLAAFYVVALVLAQVR
jgi:hypothetical protein